MHLSRVCLAFVFQLLTADAIALFEYGADEEVVFADDFETFDAWSPSRTYVEGGELRALAGTDWSSASHSLVNHPHLDTRDVLIYWRFRTDASAGPENAKLYLYCELSSDPELLEQRSIAVNIRPKERLLLYLDPGWMMPHDPEISLSQPTGFAGPADYESFRLRLRKESADQIGITLCQYSDQGWVPYASYSAGDASLLPLHLEVSTEMDGRLWLEGIKLQMRKDIPQVDAIAVTVAPSANSGFGIWQASQFSETELSIPAISGPYADSDKDGVLNIFEALHGFDPKRPQTAEESTRLPRIERDATGFYLTYTRFEGAAGVRERVASAIHPAFPAGSALTNARVMGADGPFSIRRFDFGSPTERGFGRLSLTIDDPE